MSIRLWWLSRSLTSSNLSRAANAAKKLAERRTPQADALLYLASQHTSPEVRRYVMTRLTNAFDEQNATRLATMVDEETDPSVKILSLKSLPKLPPKTFSRLAQLLLADPDCSVRSKATQMLPSLSDDLRARKTLELLADSNEDVREHTIKTLKNWKCESLVSELQNMIRNSSCKNRDSAILALTCMDNSQGTVALIDVLPDVDAKQREDIYGTMKYRKKDAVIAIAHILRAAQAEPPDVSLLTLLMKLGTDESVIFLEKIFRDHPALSNQVIEALERMGGLRVIKCLQKLANVNSRAETALQSVVHRRRYRFLASAETSNINTGVRIAPQEEKIYYIANKKEVRQTHMVALGEYEIVASETEHIADLTISSDGRWIAYSCVQDCDPTPASRRVAIGRVPKGDYVLNHTGRVVVLDAKTKHVHTTITLSEAVRSVEFSADSKRILIGATHLIQLWDLGAKSTLQEWNLGDAVFGPARWDPSNQYIIFSGPKCGVIDLYSEQITYLDFNKLFPEKIRDLGFTVDHVVSNRLVALAMTTSYAFGDRSLSDRKISVWDYRTGDCIKTLGLTGNIYALAFTPDGEGLFREESAAITQCYFFRNDKTDTGILYYQDWSTGAHDHITSLQFATSGNWLAFGTSRGSIGVYAVS